jgi:hypothetical protein
MLYSSTAIQVAFCFSTMNTTNIYCLFYFILCTDPGFQVMGGALKKIAQSGGRRENIWGISCEKSRFYAKKIMFSNFREGAPPPLLLDPPLRSICLSLSISNSFPVYVHAVFHFVSSLEIHNLYFGKHNKGDKSYKYMLQVANFHR